MMGMLSRTDKEWTMNHGHINHGDDPTIDDEWMALATMWDSPPSTYHETMTVDCEKQPMLTLMTSAGLMKIGCSH